MIIFSCCYLILFLFLKNQIKQKTPKAKQTKQRDAYKTCCSILSFFHLTVCFDLLQYFPPTPEVVS